MGGLKEWAYSVAVMVVFGTLAETVMPDNNYKKYIHLILGLLLLLTITRSVIDFAGGFRAGDYTERYAAAFAAAESETERAADEIERQQRESVVRIYKSALESSIAGGIESACGITPVSVEVSVADTGGSAVYGKIERVLITLPPEGMARQREVTAAAANITGLGQETIVLEEE